MNFLETYWLEIVASVALVQPLLILFLRWCWNKYVRHGHIDIFKTGNLEIGFGEFGPSIGMHGTLRALHQEQFIQKINLKLTRREDQLTHEFEWGVFRSPKIFLGKQDSVDFELPSGFMLSKSQPHRFNIQFHDLYTQDKIRDVFQCLIEEWQKKVNSLTEQERNYYVNELAATPDFVNPYRTLYIKFSKEQPYREAYAELNRLQYWKSGDYSLKFTIRTSKPNRVFEREFKFTLSKNEERTLELNHIKGIQNACGQYNMGYYHFVNPKYEDVN